MLLARLTAMGLLNPRVPRPETAQALRPSPAELLQLCHQGLLLGGLSAALDLRPDELFGPLTHALGAAAAKLRVLDVRGDRPVELSITSEGITERWELEDLGALIHNLNDLYRTDPTVKVACLLGEWEQMLQVWVVSKVQLKALLREPYFEPWNRAQLEAFQTA